jgi:hypothetical protein
LNKAVVDRRGLAAASTVFEPKIGVNEVEQDAVVAP